MPFDGVTTSETQLQKFARILRENKDHERAIGAYEDVDAEGNYHYCAIGMIGHKLNISWSHVVGVLSSCKGPGGAPLAARVVMKRSDNMVPWEQIAAYIEGLER